MPDLWHHYSSNFASATIHFLLPTMPEIKDFSARLLKWKAQYGRKGLPWQGTTDPYKVWLSEIMLQQTQVATVIERYEQFLTKFPTVLHLAKASQEDVMALWAGLGYYTRARNLYACANIVAKEYKGVFPDSASELEKLPGIGRSTAAAIAAFCYQEKTPILDGNVKRVLSRVFGITEPINQSLTDKLLWELAQQQLPTKKEQMPAYTQALMDFGATVCTRSKALCQKLSGPDVRTCIYLRDCKAHQHGLVAQIPMKTPKKISPVVYSAMLMLLAKDKVLLTKRSGEGIWGGLWTLPETPWQVSKSDIDNLDIQQQIQEFQGFESLASTAWLQQVKKIDVLALKKHVFTHRVLYFQPRIIKLPKVLEFKNKDLRWFGPDDLNEVGLPTPVKKLLVNFFDV